ncbi:MAG: hypothetical protein AB7C97_13145 [Oscillospiraceae bacterium]
MIITYNGSDIDVPEETTPIGLIHRFGYQTNLTAIWCNGRQIMFEEYETLIFSPNDNVRIAHLFIG